MGPNLYSRILAEFLGTFALLLASLGSLSWDEGPLVPALASGLAILVMVVALGGVSGAHFNPAVSLAFFLAGALRARELLAYWLAQLLGSLGASGVAALLYPGILAKGLPTSLEWERGLAAETLGTFFLVLVILMVVRAKHPLAGVAIGLTVTLLVLTLAPLSGGAFNPARWAGPALLLGSLEQTWMYLLGPTLGGVLALGVARGLSLGQAR
ncbi:MIP/aquaporin family protein [Thermus sp.]